jgi:hypothetical protein
MQKLLTLSACTFLVEHASLDDLFVHVQFVAGRSQDAFLHGIHGHQSKHSHFVFLSYSVGSILSLQVLKRIRRQQKTNTTAIFKIYLMRIPIGIKNNNGVRRLKVQTQASGSRTQQENEELRAGLVEFLEQFPSLVGLGRAVQTEVREVSPREVVLEDGHQLRHLTEEQHSVIGGLQFGQNSVQQLKLARCSEQITTRQGNKIVKVVKFKFLIMRFFLKKRNSI